MPGLPKNLLIFAICIFCISSRISAKPPPGYDQVNKSLPLLWKQRYPVKLSSFRADPFDQGILSAVHKNKKVYYYRYLIKVYRPVRGKDEKLKQGQYFKEIELWVRYRPMLNKSFDLSFARMDLLPGQNKRWLK